MPHFGGKKATNIAQRVQEPNRELDSAFVGASKHKLDSVDCDPFVKFMVEEVSGISDLPPCKEIINLRMVCVCACVYVCVCLCVVCVCVRALSSIKNVSFCYPSPNAFSVLMNSARQLQAPSLPNRISQVTNQKQKLRNDVILFLEGIQLAWQRSEVVGVGEVFVKALVDTLWYVDGHHHVLKNRSHEVPESLQHFTGYNVLESSKHRKRKVQKLSEGTIRGKEVVVERFEIRHTVPSNLAL